MLRWDAIAAGVTVGLAVAAGAWLAAGFVDGIALIGTSGVLAGLATGWVTDPPTRDDWRAGGYFGMLAAGVVGILVVVAAAASAFLGAPVVSESEPGARLVAAGVVGSPLAVPLFALEGIAGGSAGAGLRVLVADER